ncbi:MAG: hypothetical protein KKA19_05670 [Candidatus Margulisbacteria bacterium]|nr:hypothetical protein [Candidatus Margulisiibacteriota bacterium]
MFLIKKVKLNGILIVPIDINNNGQVDPEELITDRSSAIAVIENGNYPISRKNFFFTKGAPKDAVKDFIIFCLSDKGTQVINKAKTSLPLKAEERSAILKELPR